MRISDRDLGKGFAFWLVALLALGCTVATGQEGSSSDWEEAAAAAARARVAQDAETREQSVRQNPELSGVPIRRRARIGTSDPLFRNDIPYHEEWTIRCGALRLRLPAYPGWDAVKPSSDFHHIQMRTGEPGDHLALALTNQYFIRQTRSKYVNYYGLVWVPQDTAFVEMTEASFDEFKEAYRERIVASRQMNVSREDFFDFQDYQDFKEGNDERVEEFVSGYLIRAVDEPDLVMYFSTSEFIFQTPKTEIRHPMIMTVTYALIRGKMIRIEFRRLHLDDEDSVQLIAFSRQFVSDMRQLNGLGERRLR